MKPAVALAALEARGVVRPAVAYDRCPRRRGPTVARLIEQHGRDFDLVGWRLRLAPATRRYRACS
jgi:hypothetical protein